MGSYLATQPVQKLSSKKNGMDEAKILVLGLTFKGGFPIYVIQKIIDIVDKLKDFNMSVDVYDSWANPTEVKQEYSIEAIRAVGKN
ncbi:hypothetical protein [Colwellia sp. BRX10-4]|jgi:UDP-N-acetyl-D-galactosamine dehydrogenase|uniref:hypothetical protein n=1 Tax=Colwellia sp. BRX10-4 TaxID=2759843 RepID=UPI0015F4885A|nr:hypothetical protein [Colwellia sp. BRX10-4]MBA6396536.1 hypothetical protein [Colwellia sp. BRX10-4]